jgi:hypothetical protein
MADFEHRLTCVMGADGSITRSYMIERCERPVPTNTSSPGGPLQNEVKTNFSCVIGSAAEEAVEPAFCTVGLMADLTKMHVHTYDVAGRPARRSFHLACFRG